MTKTFGEPLMTDAGRDVVAFHLHRFLAHWLAKTSTERVVVTVGWPGEIADASFDVRRTVTKPMEAGWTFARLAETPTDQGQRILKDGDSEWSVVSIKDGPVTLAFALTEGRRAPEVLAELDVHVAEAIRAARRNAVRLFFDETDERDMKSMLYQMFERLPEWSGCDVAAACVLANSLEARTIEQANEADFYVMAERVFCPESAPATRVVGLAIDTRDAVITVVDAAIEHLQGAPEQAVLQLARSGSGYVNDRGHSSVAIADVDGRPDDQRSVLVPIVANESYDGELIGFLCLAYSDDAPLAPCVVELLNQLGRALGHVLRTSPLYSLSASRLSLLREVRSICEHHVASSGDVAARRTALIEDVVGAVKSKTDVPAFSIGYISPDPRTLRYVASFGWSDFDTIDLPLNVTDKDNTGVSALAARLNRHIVLAGGRAEGDQQEFKNFLWVNEGTRQIVDARAPIPPGEARIVDQPGWTRLGEYYKPARRGAYATIAHPIAFAGHVLGVAALEVDRDTDWTWWAAHAGQLIWELVSAELASAFWALGGRDLDG